MQIRILKNDFCPDIDGMNALIGQTLTVVGGDGGHFQVDEGYWFSKDDVEVVDDFVKSTPETVTIPRADLQALQSLLKKEICDMSNLVSIFKQDAKYFQSTGDKDRAKKYYKGHDKFRERTRSLEKRMKAVKKALT